MFAVLASAVLFGDGAAADGVMHVYVEPFRAANTEADGAERLRDALIARLRKQARIVVVEDAANAEATLRGEGDVWVKGYRSLNPRSGRLPSNGMAIYGGFLSVELTNARHETLWSSLASENATEQIFDRLAKTIAERLAAFESSARSPAGARPANGTNDAPSAGAAGPGTAAGAVAAAATDAAGFARERVTLKLKGAGATFPAPLYAKWFTAYAEHDPSVAIDYESVGSEEGVRRLLAGTADFAACDHLDLFRSLAADRAREYLLVPSVVGAVVPIVNLPGVTGELALTPDALAAIYLGTVNTWNDPLLQQSNRNLRLPALPITVVHRAEGSGTTYTWTDYLSRTSAAWRDRVGISSSPAWPTGRAANGNDGVAKDVLDTPGAIGYVEYIYAIRAHLTYARVRNRSGAFVSATLESIAAAAITVDRDMSIIDAPGRSAYPIASFTWLAIPTHLPDARARNAVTGFLQWMLTSGQHQSAALGYLALPTSVAERAEAAITEIH